MQPPLVDEPMFPEAWEGRAFALALLSTRVAGWNLDAFRHALERLSRTEYLDDGYFGRWLNAAELVLTDSAVLAPKAVEARAGNLRGQHVVEPPPSQPVRPDYAPTAEGSLRAVDAAPAHLRLGPQLLCRDIGGLPAGIRGACVGALARDRRSALGARGHEQHGTR